MQETLSRDGAPGSGAVNLAPREAESDWYVCEIFISFSLVISFLFTFISLSLLSFLIIRNLNCSWL